MELYKASSCELVFKEIEAQMAAIDHVWRNLSEGAEQKQGNFVERAVGISLLYFFIISCLKRIAETYNSAEYTEWSKKQKESEYQSLLKLVDHFSNVGVTDAQINHIVFFNMRKIRDDFAHGNWQKLEKSANKVTPEMAFELTTRLIRELEKGVISNKTN